MSNPDRRLNTLTVQVHQVEPNREDLFNDTPSGNGIVSRADGRYSLLKNVQTEPIKKKHCPPSREWKAGENVHGRESPTGHRR